MVVTLHRYKIIGANWERFSSQSVKNIVITINKLPFQGEIKEKQYGITNCEEYNQSTIYGSFIQKFPTVLKDYNSKTKEEIKKEDVDSGTYLFILDLRTREIFMQIKRDADLPSKDTTSSRLRDLLKIAFNKNGLTFSDLKEAYDEVNRDKIVKLFYEEAEEVLELELKDFDSTLIEEEKRKRGGKRQTYFNPKEEYQEAMEEAALRVGQTVDKSYLKAKKGESLKKNPVARAMLEVSKTPKKIVYKQKDSVITASGIINRKIEVHLEDNKIPLNKQIEGILEQLEPLKITIIKPKKLNQTKLF